MDGVSSWSLAGGIAVLSALSVLSVFVAAAVLWGTGSGLVAASAYAVAPIRLDPAYWHGLGTALAMVFVPLVVMSLALLFRGARGRRQVLLLAVALLGVATAHSTSTIVVAMLLGTAVLVDLAVTLVAARRDAGEAPGRWWRERIVRPLGAAVAVACVLGVGILAHLAFQAEALGAPVNYRFLDPGWLDRASLEHYYGAAFLVVSVVAVALVLSSSRLRRDRGLLAVASLVLACVVVSQLWRVHVSFDYQRVVYYVGVALVLLIGAAFTRRSPRALWVGAFVLAIIVVARASVGLRLPERVAHAEPRDPAVSGLLAFGKELDDGALPGSARIVSDGCLHFAAPYLLRRPTLPAFGERQVGFVDRLPLARQAAAIVRGDAAGTVSRRGSASGTSSPTPRASPASLGGSAGRRSRRTTGWSSCGSRRVERPSVGRRATRVGVAGRREAAEPGDQRRRHASVAEPELEPRELRELVDDRVRDPAAPARAPEPRQLLPGVPSARSAEGGPRGVSLDVRVLGRDPRVEEPLERRRDRVRVRVANHGPRLVDERVALAQGAARPLLVLAHRRGRRGTGTARGAHGGPPR